MQFLGIGFAEVLLVMIIAVIVFGPDRLPEFAVQLARAIKYLRGYATSATSEMRAELAELTKEYEEVRKELQDFRKSMQTDVATVTTDIESVTKEASRAVDEGSRTIELTQPILEPGGELPPELDGNDGHTRTP